MTKAELVELICSKHEMSKKQSAEVLETLFATLQTSIKSEEKFTYPGFGTFTVRHRKARMGTDPRTKAQIQIPASKTVGFKPAKAFKETL
jgi:DNA-binding protein HU-beta